MLTASDLHMETIDDLPPCIEPPLLMPVMLLGSCAAALPFAGVFAGESSLKVLAF